VNKLFVAYRVLAILVGVLLAFCSLVALPLKYLAPDGSSLQTFGEQASIMWVAHGWVFMIYVVTILALAAGLIPLLIFWVEHRVSQRFKAEHPELA
jgi:hypothetical protein